MNILLVAINAKYIHTNLAVRYLKNYAEQNDFVVQMKEYTINHLFEEILGGIYIEKPDILCFSCYIWNIEIIKRLCIELKKLLPKIQIWLGGPEVTYHSREFLLKNPGADLIMRGEGENIFLNLLKALEQSTEFSDISGIVYRINDEICETLPAPAFDMALLPFAYHDLDLLEHKIVYFETSRGCPFACSYCLSSLSKGVHLMPAELACSYLDIFLAKRVPQVKFVDRTFNCNKAHANAILSHLIANDNGVTNFHFEISADILDDSTIALIQQARDGLFQFEVGVQSVNPQTIQSIHRRCDNNKLFEKVAQLKKRHNVHVHLDLIAGLPYEDYTSFGKSYDRVFAASPDMLQLGFLKVLKGSVMERECEQYGIVYQEKSPYEVLFTNWLSYDDVLKLKKIEKLNETYCNSGRFLYSLKTVLKRFHSPFHFLEELSDYFTKNDFFERGWAKYDAYLFLYDFYTQKFGESDQLKWMMRHDIFSRENAKSIPALLSETMFHIYRKQIEAFYDNPENIERFLPHLEGGDSRKISKITHLEIYPFCIFTEQPDVTAILYDYGTKDVAGNAKVIWLKNFI